MEFRELECFVVLSEELHFARAAERLYVSPGRVSQLVRALETRIGARLFERSSRSVRLTPLGERFLADLRPAYDGLAAAMEQAKAGARRVEGVLRVGFQGSPSDVVMGAVRAFERRHPRCEVVLAEVLLSDPFSRLRDGEVDVTFTLLPVEEPDVVTGPALNNVPVCLGLSKRHPLASRRTIGAEELAGVPLIGLDTRAPRPLRELIAPTATPEGRPVPSAGTVATSQEGFTQVALNRGGMLFCSPTAAQHGRPDIVFVPVTGLPPSRLGLAWLRSAETATIRAFNEAAATVIRSRAGDLVA
ncbi:LysR family transcriptional regulator [Nonomuraea sp. NPDC005983]|uniref:LysR substrate-binding domain-containing protein n=1 Tax=Nonomuraea sp. NPDC005983 TaxID=3155595 RepID=UPI0033B2A43B